ncbi:uncharacterized protein LOC121870759 [Homarus americanus]|nr:uncharacterized protein LOC121870759 [Homarus americanus]
MVTQAWNGKTLLTGIPFQRCFASSHDPRDIALSIANSSSSSTFNSDRNSQQMYNGYTCFFVDYCFMTINTVEPYWKGDLGVPYQVSTIKILTRQDANTKHFFQDVTVRLGNSSDYFSNPIFAFYAGPAPLKALVTLVSPSPAFGRYLLIQSGVSDFFCMCSIQIFK